MFYYLTTWKSQVCISWGNSVISSVQLVSMTVGDIHNTSPLLCIIAQGSCRILSTVLLKRNVNFKIKRIVHMQNTIVDFKFRFPFSIFHFDFCFNFSEVCVFGISKQNFRQIPCFLYILNTKIHLKKLPNDYIAEWSRQIYFSLLRC